MMSRRFVSAVCALLVLVQSLGCTQLTRVRDNIQALRQVKRRVLQQTEPKSADDPSMELLTKEMDWLEQQIDTFGTIVPKHPDVWGEARLTKYRQAVEGELAKELTKFSSTLQGNVQRSDSAFLSIAATLNSVAKGQTAPTTNSTANNLLVNSGAPLTPEPTTLTAPSAPTAPSTAISLEPSIFVDQMNRYLNHLNELRRINNGDDTSDSPGYALRLVRIPISVLPGKRTRRGYAAELTITAQPQLADDLLPTTFRNLVVNDLIQQLTLPITKAVNDERIEGIYQEIHQVQDAKWNAVKMQTPEYVEEFKKTVYPVAIEMGHNISATKNRRARFSFPPRHLTQNYGLYSLGNVALDAWAGLHQLPPSNAPHPNQVIHLTDVQEFLHGEVNAAYDLLSQPEMAGLWEVYCTPELVRLVRERKVEALKALRDQFHDDGLIRSDFVNGTHATTALAWAIILESALLNDRLIRDYRDVAGKADCCLDPSVELPFYGPNPPLEARESFKQYVQCRWPIKVFALDPVEEDQNVAETYGRRRELQLAMAISVATGNMSANAASRFARTLETDIQSIDLNKTAVGFSHGNDTFGWRFMPRLQSPPTPTTLQTLSQELGGGPTPDQDLRDRMLEPGIRECTAIIVMPSFVQYVDFHSRANWNGLTNPAKKELTVYDTMRLSKSHRAISKHYSQLCNSSLYRNGDVRRLGSVIDQIARRMPLQSMPLRVPVENRIGGFGLFDSSVNELGPELHGWYGAPGIKLGTCQGCDECEAPANTNAGQGSGSNPSGSRDCICKGTTLFLVGRHFSIQDTRVIAGGKCIPDVTLISQDIMQVNIPAGVYPVTFCDQLDGQVKQSIDVHIATPYGVTNHLLIPVYEPRDVPCQKAAAPDHNDPVQKNPTTDSDDSSDKPQVIPVPQPDPATLKQTKVESSAPVITDAQAIVFPPTDYQR